MTRLRHWIVRVFIFLILGVGFVIIALAAFIGYVAIARKTPLVLPAPTGAYPVGRVQYDWVDQARIDPLADQAKSPRELAVWVWYPAAAGGNSPAPYLPPDWVAARNKDQGIGILVENDFNRFRTHSFENIPLASSPSTFPVLIMEPGLGPAIPDYTVFAENLASHGYIVAGINPTDSSNLIVFPDGRLAPRTARGTIPDNDTLAQANADADRIEAVWVQDVIFVMDQLQKLNTSPTSLFSNHLDLGHIGVWGHSLGGATAIAVCEQDPRCQAGVNMDGTPWSIDEKTPLPTPFMFITEDYRQGCDSNCAAMRQVYLTSKPGAAYLLSIAGTRHFNFSDLPLRQVPVLRPLFMAAGYEGSIEPARALQITNAYLVAFFDQYLKGNRNNLLNGPSPDYPEVQIEKR